MDRETREFLEQKFSAIDEKFSGIDRRLAGIDEKFEETKRHFDVVSEGLRVEIRQVAEGVANVDEKLEREVAGLREEMTAGFSEVKSLINVSYRELDRRVRALEAEG